MCVRALECVRTCVSAAVENRRGLQSLWISQAFVLTVTWVPGSKLHPLPLCTWYA